MRPDDLDVMFVTDANEGVFESLDGGINWFPSSEGITTRTGATGDAIPIFCLTIDPNDNDIVWAGTQNTRGIFKSVDGGSTWTKMDRGIVEQDGITFRGFTVDPGNSDVVYAAAEISSWIWSSDRQPHNGREFDLTAGVVYKTTNGGQSWKAVWRGDNLARYVWINPQNTDIIYVSTGIFDREAANSDPVQGIPGGEGVLKSTDGGLTWENINNGIHNLYVGSLFMHPTNPDILLAGAGSNQYNDGAGVYLTLNGGQTWQQTLSDVMQITSVEISTSDPNIAYAASRFKVYRSTDGGRTWVPVTSGNTWGAPGAQTGFPIDLQVDPRDPDRLFANAYGGGVFMSEDGGRTWVEASKGYTGAMVRAVVVDPTAPARVIAAARSGVFASSDGGTNWHGISSPSIDSIEWNALAIDPANPQHMLGGMSVGGGLLVITSNGGTTWRPVANLETFGMGWRAIAYAPSDPDVIYAGTAGYVSAGSFDNTLPGMGIYFSTNGGLSWERTADALARDAHVTALAVDPSDPQTVFATTLNHGLIKSTDGGHSWSEIPGNWMNNYWLLAVSINPEDPNVILLGASHGGIYKSTDGGATWKHPVSGLAAEATVTSIVFDPVNPSQVLYLSDRLSGVYRSTDGGQTWQVINTGLSMRAIQSLAISSDGLHLYAASDGSGVFRLDLNGQPPAAAMPPTAIPTTIPATTIIPPPGAASPTPEPIGAASPTPEPNGKPGICSSALVLPFVFTMLVWKKKSR
jgi:photosystem II stability/assembly factor-like uncharacterized protein